MNVLELKEIVMILENVLSAEIQGYLPNNLSVPLNREQVQELKDLVEQEISMDHFLKSEL